MLDDIDIKIIRTLLVDGRTNFSEIADDCGVSSPTIHNRYKKLKDAGIITGSTIVMDFEVIGIKYFASFFIRLDRKQISTFENYAKRLTPITYYDPTKHFNMHIILPAKSIKEIEKMKNNIRQQPGVIEINSSIWTEWLTLPQNLAIDQNSKSSVK